MAAEDGKWRATVEEVIPAPIDKVWEILSDFDGLHRHFPKVFSACDTVEGEVNKVGSLRYVEAPLPTGYIVKASERLLSVDHVKHTTTYSIEEINLGWTGYQGHIVADSYENDHTIVHWTFEVNPMGFQAENEYIVQQKGLFETLLGFVKEKFSK